MADTDDHGRTDPPLAGDEAATLIGFLDYHRDTLAWKTAGLDAAGLSTTVGASDMTLGGILKHLALVEDDWFGCCLLGRPASAPWTDVDWNADRDWDWHTCRRGQPGRAPRALGGRGRPVSTRSRHCLGVRRPRPARRPALGGRSGTQPALDPGPPDRGVRPPQRSRRSAP